MVRISRFSHHALRQIDRLTACGALFALKCQDHVPDRAAHMEIGRVINTNNLFRDGPRL